MERTVQEINEKISNRTVRVVTAEEMTARVAEQGAATAAAQVDVVTTGTFGAMCSSGAFVNFGHSEPPMKMARVWLNDVEVCAGVAAVDAYIGATQARAGDGEPYGGAHLIEDLLAGRPVVLRAVSAGSDCYPRKEIVTELTLADLNQALLCNPRNAYQRYHAAANSGGRELHTYMGTLRPRLGNVHFSGAGELSPLNNDPQLRSIGAGTRIFLGGGTGLVTGAGTQHDPEGGFATLMVQGDLRQMAREFLRAAVFRAYGCTLYVGLGVPLPILDEACAAAAGVADRDIGVNVLDYAVARRQRPVLKRTNYAELKSGTVEFGGRRVPCAALSSLAMARRVALTLRDWIRDGGFRLGEAVDPLPRHGSARPLAERTPGGPPLSPPPAVAAERAGWDANRCLHCGACTVHCPAGALRLVGDALAFAASRCTGCGACGGVCPVGALVAPGGER